MKPHEASTAQTAVDNAAHHTSLFKSPPSELSIGTTLSAASNTDISDELALKIVHAKQNVSNAKHQLTQARIQKADKDTMTKLMLDKGDAEHKLQDLRMQREKEKIQAWMKREGSAQGSPTVPIKSETAGATMSAVKNEDPSVTSAMQHQVQETSEEYNQGQQGFGTPGTESTIPAETTTLAERGMVQQLRMEDAKSYLPETIPDQGVQLTYDLDRML
ncbi:hypothetical protein V5O48_012014 [Marasmius crinis-equi]|uniref:Uncharacterized protein n=1 Tax=Marasmius crinis-equi TaxID=585013 RepID=A0ABR3F3Z0_9AGAR